MKLIHQRIHVISGWAIIFYDHISRSIPDTVSNIFSWECERSINYCNATWEEVEENKILAQPMDCPKKFKEYCKCLV